jgi:stage IV sporulation protein FB
MRDLLSWNLPLGRWAGVQVRLHVFFILFAVFALHYCTVNPQEGLLWYGVAVIVLLYASVLAHEFGHCVAAVKVGGQPEQILLWPFGGLVQINVSRDPGSERIIAVTGPLVNSAVCVILAPILLVVHADLTGLFNPIMPPPAVGSFNWIEGLRLAFWLNWVLVVVNLLPAYPLDGGRILRSLLWPRFGYRTSVLYVARAAKVAAIGIWILAYVVHSQPGYQYAMLPLALLGVFLFFSARQEAERLREQDAEEDLAGYDFSPGYPSLDQNDPPRRPTPGPVRQWLESRRAARLQRQMQLAEEEERKADEVLARLHESGLNSLSEEDRALLDRVSARLRSRLRR